MADQQISANDPHPKRRVLALDVELATVDIGQGDPGGVPARQTRPRPTCGATSSPTWRGNARCLAPDLLGMGESDRAPDGSYRFMDHARYLDAWFDALSLTENVTLVSHDWGSALAFHWANRHRERVKGIAYMEAIVRPLAWDEWPERSRGLFQSMRSPDGEQIILERNVFVERILPASVIRGLTEAEMEVYRRPLPGARRVPPANPHLAPPDSPGRASRPTWWGS